MVLGGPPPLLRLENVPIYCMFTRCFTSHLRGLLVCHMVGFTVNKKASPVGGLVSGAFGYPVLDFFVAIGRRTQWAEMVTSPSEATTEGCCEG